MHLLHDCTGLTLLEQPPMGSTNAVGAEGRAAEVVREYLRFHGYANTLKCIEAERLQQHPEHASTRTTPRRRRTC